MDGEAAKKARMVANQLLAERIDLAREKIMVLDRGKMRPMSQNKLEALVGMKRGYLARIRSGERGTSIKREWQVALARELKVNLTWLMAGLGPMAPTEGEAPTGGRALGLFIAATYLNASEEAIKAAEAAFDENAPPLTVAAFAEHKTKEALDRMSAAELHARAGRDRGVEIDKAKKRAEREAAKKPPPPPKAPPSSKRMPASKRKVVGD